MSSGGGVRWDRDQEFPLYDQVPVESLWRDQEPPRSLALSLDPLPPPPLPQQPAVGLPDIIVYPPSGGEERKQPDGDRDDMDIKPVHRFIPDSFKKFFRSNSGGNRSSSDGGVSFPPPPPPPDSPAPSSTQKDPNNQTTLGVRCSPPSSPSLSGSSYRDPFGGSGGSYNSRKERDALLLGAEAFESVSEARTYRSAMTYIERVEEYHQRYAYMKSWAGLLRILGCVELLLGAVVFACVCAYVHKDNEWFNMYGYSQPQLYGGLGGGAAAYGQGSYYTGPKTAFVLVIAGLVWIVTVVMLVLGITMVYRTILLDSSWWPLTECVINLVLGTLYMAAGTLYVRDTTRGGLCSMPVFNNGVNGAFCRAEAGQNAAITFLFVNMICYLIGTGVCLKLWRHEAARLRREGLAQEMKTIGSSIPLSVLGASSRASDETPLPTLQGEAMDAQENHAAPPPTMMMMKPEILQGHIPAGHIPKPLIIADYVAKYPAIHSDEERDQYKAVFNDQYAEYKELHAEVQVLAKKFEEMDDIMRNLPPRPSSQLEKERIDKILQEYQRKKADPTFLEKRDRCEYLKNKLSHIKQKIQEYNKVKDWSDGLSG